MSKIIFGKVILAVTLLAASVVANAATVVLTLHHRTSPGSSTIITLITDGSHVSGIVAASTVTFDWDGTTLTGTGYYSALHSLGNGSAFFNTTIQADSITDLTIDTGSGLAGSTTAYSCIEGVFPASLGVNGCGGYTLGGNFTDESTTIWGPGLAVTQTLGGDDVGTSGPRTISAYDFGTVTLLSGASTTTAGATFSIGNGIAVGVPTGEAMFFTVIPVPAAAWLFGSALGLLGWMRRKTT